MTVVCILVAFFLILKEAFDTANYKFLLSKLECYGIRRKAKDWFSSFIHNRQQFTSIDGQNSDLNKISHRVPQGSILGPLLILELLKGANGLQSNSDFMNKIKESSNTAIFEPNVTIKQGALFITNCSRHSHENKELQIMLTILDLSRGINKTSNIT